MPKPQNSPDKLPPGDLAIEPRHNIAAAFPIALAPLGGLKQLRLSKPSAGGASVLASRSLSFPARCILKMHHKILFPPVSHLNSRISHIIFPPKQAQNATFPTCKWEFPHKKINSHLQTLKLGLIRFRGHPSSAPGGKRYQTRLIGPHVRRDRHSYSKQGR